MSDRQARANGFGYFQTLFSRAGYCFKGTLQIFRVVSLDSSAVRIKSVPMSMQSQMTFYPSTVQRKENCTGDLPAG